MKKYYLLKNSKQEGPFDLSELKKKNVNKDTQIWYEGLENWTTIGEVDELHELLVTPPPPPTPIPQIKKKRKWGFIFTSIIILITAGLVVSYLIYNADNADNDSDKSSSTYQEKVMTVEQIEQNDPSRFLKASGTYNKNFWGTAMKIHGEIENIATVANYKDVVVEVIFYSETETELDRKQYTIYDYFPAHSTKSFEIKADKPAGCNKLGWEAKSAKTY